MTKIRSFRFLSLLLTVILAAVPVPAAALAEEFSDEECACEYSEDEECVCEEGEAAVTETGDVGCDYLTPGFSVTVPANLSLTVSQDGTVYAADNASIVNNSSGAVNVTAVTVQAGSGWTLVPYSTNMADTGVDTKQIGFIINNAETKQTGFSETLVLGTGWNITKDGELPLNYDAVVSAMSEPVNEHVLTLVFVLDWAD